MQTIEVFNFENGKYTVFRNAETYRIDLFRYGKPMERSFTGDKLFNAVLDKVIELAPPPGGYDDPVGIRYIEYT